MKERILRRNFLKTAAIAGIGVGVTGMSPLLFANSTSQKKVRVGIIGLSVHTEAFSEMLNVETNNPDISGFTVVAIYHPKGNPDVEFKAESLATWTENSKKRGIQLVDSVDKLLEMSDVVMLETNDGRPHLEQLMPVFKARKPVFIDKPIAANLKDVITILNEARKYNVPVFSSSSLRYVSSAQEIRNGKVGRVLGADAYSPASLQEAHTDMFWYGIHGVESLYTIMGGVGCQQVTRTHSEGADVIVGTWEGGRIGVFRGIRTGSKGYGGTAFGEKGIANLGTFEGYRPLLVAVIEFFRTGKSPVSLEETLEIYAFMEAADESKKLGGVPVTLASVLAKAK
ncbi:Gfo/Idh/MocA family oxidoreductase [Daejeonella sp. JGW-45]|uniref:Gfo/Idh/MocA family protein n=1 Tax=Daejeonella sp. JGW-45 TaxID=3034148 RepID=UPI0023ECAF99|nr:Gfo/Idh/MocA family oxidoreductase [Daejeonella sp. JGW-45]